jgi:hypothetical protein
VTRWGAEDDEATVLLDAAGRPLLLCMLIAYVIAAGALLAGALL